MHREEHSVQKQLFAGGVQWKPSNSPESLLFLFFIFLPLCEASLSLLKEAELKILFLH